VAGHRRNDSAVERDSGQPRNGGPAAEAQIHTATAVPMGIEQALREADMPMSAGFADNDAGLASHINPDLPPFSSDPTTPSNQTYARDSTPGPSTNNSITQYAPSTVLSYPDTLAEQTSRDQAEQHEVDDVSLEPDEQNSLLIASRTTVQAALTGSPPPEISGRMLKCPHPACNDSELEFTLKNDYTKHWKNVHAPKAERLFQCSVCQEMWLWRKDLVRHKRKHTAERPFRCDLCKKRYKRRDGLIRHLRESCRALYEARALLLAAMKSSMV
jgi:hypothetical protein